MPGLDQYCLGPEIRTSQVWSGKMESRPNLDPEWIVYLWNFFQLNFQKPDIIKIHLKRNIFDLIQ